MISYHVFCDHLTNVFNFLLESMNLIVFSHSLSVILSITILYNLRTFSWYLLTALFSNIQIIFLIVSVVKYLGI